MIFNTANKLKTKLGESNDYNEISSVNCSKYTKKRTYIIAAHKVSSVKHVQRTLSRREVSKNTETIATNSNDREWS